jgi:hypothetical protein
MPSKTRQAGPDQNIDYTSYPTMIRSLVNKYGRLPMDRVMDAFARSWDESGMFTANPYIQNRRVKQISSLPVQYQYNEVADMVQAPDDNEEPLREVSHVLESTAAPYFKIRKTYQDIMTYHWYNSPMDLEDGDEKKRELWREMRLIDRFCEEMAVQQNAHMIVGQCLQEGKVFYVPRWSLDKSHNKVNYAFMQQLPQDWTKIVGFNNISKYTVAVDMMYFMQPGTDWRQYGSLFEPYLDVFRNIAPDLPRRDEKRFVYASGYERFNELKKNRKLAGNPDLYYQDGRWFYWVTLPIDRVWAYEVDDVNRNVVPPYTGLFLAMANIAKYEQVQLSLVQNPLVSMVLGEIPYRDNTNATAEDAYRLSPSGRSLFEAYFYQMLYNNNTSGIGLYTGPFDNLHLEQLAEAPSATEISSTGYKYAMQKSGIGIIPSSDDPRAGTVQVALMIECRFADPVYKQFGRMMSYLYSQMGLKWEWRFRMFGSLATDEKDEKACVNGMTLGILPDTLKYLALHDMRLSEDMAVSRMIKGSGLLDLRIPLISSYSAKNENGLPPQAGRPKSEGVTSEGQEQDLDSPTEDM